MRKMKNLCTRPARTLIDISSEAKPVRRRFFTLYIRKKESETLSIAWLEKNDFRGR